MYTTDFRLVDGTSALEPDCSRYSNENERIISFDRAAADWRGEIDYHRIAHARHTKRSDHVKAGIIAMMDKSRCIHEVRTGNLKGTAVSLQDAWKMKAYGCLYTVLAVIAILTAL